MSDLCPRGPDAVLRGMGCSVSLVQIVLSCPAPMSFCSGMYNKKHSENSEGSPSLSLCFSTLSQTPSRWRFLLPSGTGCQDRFRFHCLPGVVCFLSRTTQRIPTPSNPPSTASVASGSAGCAVAAAARFSPLVGADTPRQAKQPMKEGSRRGAAG